jgi:hypothetical protein
VSALETQFRNEDTGQFSEYWIVALGVGLGYHFSSRWLHDLHEAFSHLQATMPTSGHWHYSSLDVRASMTHADWHGRFVMFVQAGAGVVAGGWSGVWLHIPAVLEGPVFVSSPEVGLAGFGAEVGGSIGTTVWHRMPPENRGSMRASPAERLTPFQYDVPRDFSHECLFDTESSTLLNGEAERLRTFARSLVQDYEANRPRGASR